MALTLSYFFFDLPLYSPYKITEEDKPALKGILDYSKGQPFNGYNPFSELESTFQVITDLLPHGTQSDFMKNGGFGTVQIKCKRTDVVFNFYIIWRPVESEIEKVGQFPSVADFHISEVKQYKKVLGSAGIREFTRAIGLAANGVGIGSFVYLRRIFEGLIDEAYEIALSENAVTQESYMRSRMDEKIQLLSDYLPRFLVEHKSMYSILSLGIHELEEKDCLAHFDSLRVGIEIILDERLEAINKAEKIKTASLKLGLIHKQIASEQKEV